MYTIDFERIERQLDYLEKCLHVLNETPALEDEREQLVEEFAIVRALHLAIECITDVGTVIIDGFIMRDPASYEDIVEILRDEKILPDDEASEIKELVKYRRKLVVYYTEVTREEIRQLVTYAKAATHFPERIRTYLKNQFPST